MQHMIKMPTWDELRKQAKKLENDIDSKLVAFSRLGSSYGSSSYRDSDGLLDTHEAMAMEIQQLLMQLAHIDDDMTKIVDKDPSPALAHALSRHRDILNDRKAEFHKTRRNLLASRDRADLLGSVQRDINEHRMGVAHRQDLFLKEHTHTQNSNRLTQDAIGIAINTKDALHSQRKNLDSISSRINNTFDQFPVLKNLMNSIGLRKKRDSVIMACVISACIIILFLYVVG